MLPILLRTALIGLVTSFLITAFVTKVSHADRLATLVESHFDYNDDAEIGPRDYLWLQHVSTSYEDIFLPLGNENVGVAKTIIFEPVSWTGARLYQQIWTRDADFYSVVVPLDQAAGKYEYAGSEGATSTVTRILSLGDESYTRALWTMDSFRREWNVQQDEYNFLIEFTGRYYVAPEPSTFALLFVGVGAIHIRRR